MRLALALVAVGLCGCGSSSTVAVAPSGGPPIEDNFFVTWELESGAFGPIDCASANAATVDMDIVNADSGERFIYSFPCDDYQGTSGMVSVGTFDVLVNLSDPGGGVISQVDIGTENLSTAGTIDLGHVVFQLP